MWVSVGPTNARREWRFQKRGCNMVKEVRPWYTLVNGLFSLLNSQLQTIDGGIEYQIKVFAGCLRPWFAMIWQILL